MLASAMLFASAIGVLKSLMFVLFMFVGLLMVLIVLLQEPKGGGLSGAFGGVGAETFGVQTGGVNKFTSWLAGIFLVLALAFASIREPEPDAPSALPSGTTTAAPSDGEGVQDQETTTPPTDDGTDE